MTIKDWPITEQPREKLLHQGPHSLSDAELLSIFIRTGIRGKSAVDLARDLIKHFGNLRALFNASPQELTQMMGMGPAKYSQIQASIELARRYLKEMMVRDEIFKNPQDTRNYLIARLRDHTQEVFACIFLDNRNRLIAYEEPFYGTIHSAAIYPREIVKRALYHNAAGLIVAHNHPSGIAEPSKADESITQELTKALKLIEVRLLDHFIIGDGAVTSLAERGVL